MRYVNGRNIVLGFMDKDAMNVHFRTTWLTPVDSESSAQRIVLIFSALLYGLFIVTSVTVLVLVLFSTQ